MTIIPVCDVIQLASLFSDLLVGDSPIVIETLSPNTLYIIILAELCFLFRASPTFLLFLIVQVSL